MMEAVALPRGTLTFLLSDVEGSTRRWEDAPDAMAIALPWSLALVEDAVAAHGGYLPVEQGEGDSRLAVFERSADASAAAVAIQRAHASQAWPEGAALRVRVALHVADARLRDERTYGGAAVHRAARLRELGRGGQILVSRAVHDLLTDDLPDTVTLVDLGRHRLRDLSRPEQVFELRHRELAPVEGGLRSLAAVPNNLPSSVSSFVGRAGELAEVAELLAAHRLVTLTGPGGCGKTRLALEAAADAAADRPGGVWLVELSGLADPDLLADSLLGAVDVGEAPGVAALDRVAAYLQDRRALVLFDTCEHLIEAAAAVAERLLAACPHLAVLATSREPLGVGVETTWRVPPLCADDAVGLFVERARQSRPNFSLDAGNAETVAGVCRRLDGIPLAIELAAARVRALSVERILAGLDDRFRLLAGGSRTALPRQQTLQASVEWSHDLLSAPERVALRRVSVFAGPFDLDAAEAVIAGGDVTEVEAFDLLVALVTKSLVQADADAGGEVRYSLLDTIRHFGRDRLVDAGEIDHIRDRHLGWLVALARSAGPGLDRADIAVLDRLDGHLDDIRVGLDWGCTDLARAAGAVEVCGNLGFWWSLRGRYREGSAGCERVLAAAGGEAAEPETLLARWAQLNATFYAGDVMAALGLAGRLAVDASETGLLTIEARARNVIGISVGFVDSASGLEELDRAVEQAVAGGDDWTVAEAHQLRAFVKAARSDWTGAIADLDFALPTAEGWQHGYLLGWDGGGRSWIANLTGNLAGAERAGRAGQRAGRRVGESTTDAFATLQLAWSLAEMGRLDEAFAELDQAESALIRRPGMFTTEELALGRARVLAMAGHGSASVVLARAVVEGATAAGINLLRDIALTVLAHGYRLAGDLPAARRVAADALRAAEAYGNSYGHAAAQYELAANAVVAGDGDEAEEAAQSALGEAAALGARPLMVRSLELLGSLSADDEPLEAARLLAATNRARDEMELVPGVEEQATIARARARVEEHLRDGSDAAFADGERLDLVGACEYARRGRGQRRRPSTGWASLTPTEQQVVNLVVEGLTNPQIGQRLYVSRGTVKTHLAHVFAKLGVTTRAELAVAATRHDESHPRPG
jgi:predicted ATPase/class 3 adenylate cyclase/DNA-binding CsgD family transcriptional regulator